MNTNKEYAWWQTGIIYEIYVRSFQDSNGDGIGDLRGIIQRLDYLKSLGITGIWLTPIYQSPMKDFGYDISNYKEIDPLFGTFRDFSDLIEEVHNKGMKLIMDLVPNHTSNKHPWFLDSRSSKDSPKRDWYYWKDASPDGSKPNNWLSVLGGTAWEWDKQTQQYYYHAFLKEQPDLNLRNEQVREAIFDVMRFWLEKGVDGFRVDVMWHLIKDDLWRDNPINPYYTPDMADCDKLEPVFQCNQPEVHDLIQQMRNILDEYVSKVMIGEIYLSIDEIVTYYGKNNNGANLPANFQLLLVDWKAEIVALAIAKYEGILAQDSWPHWVIGNHDRPRLISRIGASQSRIAAMLLLTLRGTPTIYYGDETGMDQVFIPEAEVKDPQGLLMPGKNLSRDGQRTPMQWNNGLNAGFTSGKPWLPIADNYKELNIDSALNDDNSVLSLYRKLINLRKSEPSLKTGKYIPLPATAQLVSYIRSEENADRFLVVLNLTGENTRFSTGYKIKSGSIVLSSSGKRLNEAVNNEIDIEGNEGLIIRLHE